MTVEETHQPVEEQQERPERPRGRGWRRLLIAVGVCVAGVAVILGGAYCNNNVSRMSDDEFLAALDQSLEKARAWVTENADPHTWREHNVAEYYFLQDMDAMHSTPAFAEMVRWYLQQPARPAFWRRQLDPKRPVLTREMNDALQWTALDYRWAIYALAPDRVSLDPADVEAMFDSERWDGLYLAHQLWALGHMRRISSDPRASDELMRRLAQRIVREHATDILYHEIHAERLGMVMWTGYPQLIRRRWVERIVANQLEDGGWNARWYLLTVPLPWTGEPKSDVHSTLVALWALYQARYRSPQTFGLPPAGPGAGG